MHEGTPPSFAWSSAPNQSTEVSGVAFLISKIVKFDSSVQLPAKIWFPDISMDSPEMFGPKKYCTGF